MSIEVKKLSFVYGKGTPFETTAIKDVSFTIEKGEFVGIMGHTGCGKSTVIQLVAGLIQPETGKVRVDGDDINLKSYDRGLLRRKVGLLFQYPECQLFENTVEKDVAFGLKNSGLSKSEETQRVKWAIAVTGFDFEKLHGQSPMGLSGGEKRRIAIAGVLAAKPEYLILDEPIAGLDPLARDDFLELITKLNSDGMTIIMVSHNADCLGEYAKRILVFDHGELVEDGATEAVFSDVEKMKARSLGVSESRHIAYLLEKRGLNIAQNITTYEQLLSAVVSMLNGRGGGI